MTELKAIWTEQARQRICFNGCTTDALVRRYGAKNLKHKSGVGWFKLTHAA